jgi:predicted ribosome quality control (RQC) complex YloA/Tae2 family protein
MRKKNKQTTLYDEVEKYCKEEYRARYLKMRNRAVLNLVLPKHPILARAVEGIDKAILIEFAKDIQTYARSFRQVLEAHPEWTNEQEKYEKMIKEQENQIQLGYTPGYHEDIKNLKML